MEFSQDFILDRFYCNFTVGWQTEKKQIPQLYFMPQNIFQFQFYLYSFLFYFTYSMVKLAMSSCIGVNCVSSHPDTSCEERYLCGMCCFCSNQFLKSFHFYVLPYLEASCPCRQKKKSSQGFSKNVDLQNRRHLIACFIYHVFFLVAFFSACP